MRNKDQVLIVDDSRTMRLLLRQALEQFDFIVHEAENGEAALKSFQHINPDVILLDIEMPGMNGFDTCKALRLLPKGEYVPIVITTAFDDLGSINKAYEVRATDFLTKPVNWDLLGHRVRYIIRTSRDFIELQKSKIELLNVQDELKKLNLELEARVLAATSQLKETNQELSSTLELLRSAQNQLITSEKMRTFSHFVTEVAEEFHGPIEECLKQNELLKELLDHIFSSYNMNQLTNHELKTFFDNALLIVPEIVLRLKRMSNLIMSFKQFSIYQATELVKEFNLKTQLEDTIYNLESAIKEKGVEVILSCPSSMMITSYPESLYRILSILIMNSLTHAFDSNSGTINIAAKEQDDRVMIVYSDNGKGIAPEHIEKVFTPFFSTKIDEGFAGLGLHIAYKQVNEILHGDISCDSKVGQGTTFTLNLPKIVH